MDSGEKLKQMAQQKKLMEFLAKNKTSNTTTVKTEPKKRTILEIRKDLIEYRRVKAKEKNIPPCYIFTNEELDKMLMVKPRNYSELSGAMILPDIKLKIHGKEIVEIFRK